MTKRERQRKHSKRLVTKLAAYNAREAKRTCQACGGLGFHGEHRRWEQPCGMCGGKGTVAA